MKVPTRKYKRFTENKRKESMVSRTRAAAVHLIGGLALYRLSYHVDVYYMLRHQPYQTKRRGPSSCVLHSLSYVCMHG